MLHLNSKSCSADPDGWRWPAIKSDGNEHFECVLLCADYALVASENDISFIFRIFRGHGGRRYMYKYEQITESLSGT